MSDDIKDQVLVNTYGRNAPDAAKFGRSGIKMTVRLAIAGERGRAVLEAGRRHESGAP